jgi:hypothetical protein
MAAETAGEDQDGYEWDLPVDDGSNSYIRMDEEEEEELEDDDEEEEEEDDDDEEDSSMALSDDERSMALRIKEAVEEDTAINNLSDMEYAQHAILAMGDLNLALCRIQGLQCFRRDYQVDNSPSQGVKYLKQFMILQPGAILNIDICPDTGEAVFGFNRGALDPAIAFKCSIQDTVPEQNWKIHAITVYYFLHILQPSLKAVREGICFVFDGHQMSWRNINSTFTSRILGEVWYHYPFRVKKMEEYNTNVASSMFWSLLRPFMPKAWTSKWEFGCQIETTSQRTLSELYLQPSLEQAQVHILRRVYQLLSMRAQNEANFCLQ